MKINEKNAKELFMRLFPSGKGNDFAGRLMLCSEYGNNNSSYGWNIDHILPKEKNGSNEIVNLQCTNIITNLTKGSKTTWEDVGYIWQVKRIKGNRKKHTVMKVEVA